uniref:NADH-ubiquinone oxidoreductase chain 3 n=3 Tax=Antodynerus TaxID=2612822 RepID=A0A6M9ATV0_9HYME|nr:NADH dehydrogenase subunit 3 [Antodynerus aff. limbatus YN]QKK69226.1 NADH dehydrogenase subunit 3 [Antodynerus aff. limbatus GX]QKK69239.1 NADH dehydrogenase subunit 3 [Antodynerus aff. limbatus XZ]QKK69252.1 NADH dehydrogenase subunit 3 [Antodynerus aff. limbatus YN]
MILYFIISMLPMMIILILISINYFLSMKSSSDREKPSPFECGFNPLTNTRLPFSMQFFSIMIIFLIFDIEIIILIPLIPAMTLNMNLFYWFNSFFIVLSILFIGLIYEWNEQSTLWIN